MGLYYWRSFYWSDLSIFIFVHSLFTCRVYFLVSDLLYARLNTFWLEGTRDWLHWCACWLCARPKYFLPQQFWSVFPRLIHQTSTKMYRRVEWCSRLLFDVSTQKRFAHLFAQFWPWWWKCGSMPIKTKVGPPLRLHAQSLPAPGWRGKKRQYATPCYYYTPANYTSPLCTL